MNEAVLHIDTAESWRGGQQQVYLLHRTLAAWRKPTRLLARRGGVLLRRCRTEGLPAGPLPGRGPWRPGVISALARELRGVGVVHAHDSHALGLAAVAKLLRPPLRVVAHRRVSYPPGRNPASRWKCRRADAWVAVSAEVARSLCRSEVPEGRVRVIHSALDVEGFRAAARASQMRELKESLGIADGAPVVGFCGAFTPQKGHRILLEAAPRILAGRPKTVFLLAGEGGLLEDVRECARKNGLENSFRFPGFRSDVAALTRIFTVGVVPSVDGEGSSASIKEPMALGIPVVVSDLAGNLEVIGDAGLSFANRDPRELADAVLRLLGDSTLCKTLGKRGRMRAEDFRPETLAQEIVDLYGELTGGSW